MFQKIIVIFLIMSSFSCETRPDTEKEIENIPINFDLVRFDQKFANTTLERLPELKAEYPFLFPAQFPDSVWMEKIHDTIQQELNTEVTKAFPNFSAEEDALHLLFQHIKYYFPEFESPTVITITSEVDYKNKVLLSPDYLFIALDTYLGKDHPFYIGIQEYIKKNFEKNQIIQDVATEYAKQYVSRPESKSFLAHLIYYGKILYLKDAWLPSTPDNEKIGYTSQELGWVKANEDQVWRYFVERELIFNSDSQLQSRFLNPAPFSKFNLELDSESPAMVGQYIGWQIISQYMDKNEVGLQEMLDTDAETIFNNANYKPRK